MRELLWELFEVWNVLKDMVWQISIVIIVVMIFRIVVGKISKQASYLLWFVVALRLICPVMLPSQFSIFNLAGDNPFGTSPSVMSEVDVMTNSDKNNISDLQATEKTDMWNTSITNTSGVTAGASVMENETTAQTEEMSYQNFFLQSNPDFLIWLVGMTAMFIYGVAVYCRLKKRLRFATKAEADVFESEWVSSPVVFGVIKPVIYLPYHLNERERDYILAHERYHIRRRDYLVKLLAFGLLAVYWFHPLVWTAFYLMSRDMEMSCDEQVLKDFGLEERKAYSTLLLNFASKKRFPLPSPLSFGENDVKKRIKQILNHKSPTLWGIVTAVVLIAAVIICCLTDAKENPDSMNTQSGTEGQSLEELAELLYEAKNPYIGQMPANGKLLNLLKEYYGISGTNGTELQTSEEPYWITVGFDKKPQEAVMWKLASVFLALVENADEFRWEVVEEDERLYTYYVRTEDVEAAIGCDKLKAYGDSAEKIAELLQILEEKEPVIYQSLFKNYAKKANISWDVANQYELRLLRDGVNYRSDKEATVYGCIYQDFDKSGTMDFMLSVTGDEFGEAALYIYMNDDSLYVQKLPMHCFGMSAMSGDMDQDGNIEIIYIGYSGGNGGAGSQVKGILKYQNHTFTTMELPNEFTGEEISWGEAGYHIDVYWGKETNTYRIVCETLSINETITSEYLKDEEGKLLRRPIPGEVIGGNCRGYYDLKIVEENGREYLMAEEYFYGEGGVNHGLGFVRFIFEWGSAGKWSLKDYDIYTYSSYDTEQS